jgi:predicted secreted protein
MSTSGVEFENDRPEKEKIMRKLILITIIGLLLAACSPAKPTDPLVAIETSPGKEFKVVMDSNPTTGYHWEIVGELDKEIVELVSKDYRADTPQATGSGGVDIWVFRGVGPGETEITLGYYPPSNDAAEPQETSTFKVNVK